MKKTDVYVVVDTPKKAKRLKKVLDMFGEKVYEGRVWHDDGYPYYATDDCIDYWVGDSLKDSEDLKNKTEVSIKELRNILAREYLKEGDFVVINSIYNDDWVMEVDYIEGNKDYHKSAINKSSGYRFNKCFLELNFIRYATEEEKALLEPNKELEIGKWYFGDLDKERKTLFCFNGKHGQFTQYGFTSDREWSNKIGCIQGLKYTEATPKEVEQALIEEAKRRYKVGDKLSLLNGYIYGNGNGIYGDTFDDLSFCIERNTLSAKNTNGYYHNVFNNGKWATIIEQDNFTDYDISIVERLHDTLLDNHGYSLQSELLINARLLADKIKSNVR